MLSGYTTLSSEKMQMEVMEPLPQKQETDKKSAKKTKRENEEYDWILYSDRFRDLRIHKNQLTIKVAFTT